MQSSLEAQAPTVSGHLRVRLRLLPKARAPPATGAIQSADRPRRYPTAVVVNDTGDRRHWLVVAPVAIGELVGDAEGLVGGAARADGLDAQVGGGTSAG